MSVPAMQTRELAIGFPRKRKADFCLANALNLCLEAGSLVGLLGPNGVGKSTLLRTLAALQRPLVGQVLLDGEDARRLRPADLAKRLSLVLTNTPYPNMMTGFELVALGRLPHSNWLGSLSERDRAAVDWALGAVNAKDLQEQVVAELSDGQRQKLMIARALAQETAIMLLDEPTAFLDLPHRVEVMSLLKRLAHQTGRAILVSTHDLDQALRNCDQLWLMSEGAMLVGAPEDLVLNGGIAETFRTHSIGYDVGNGALAAAAPSGAAIRIKGTGIEETWMRRALERNGYRLDPEASAINLSLRQNGGGAEWLLTIEGRRSRHRSVASVLGALKDADI